MRLWRKVIQQSRREPRLSDPSLAREQHHLAFAGFGLRPAAQQQFKLLVSPDERGKPGHVQRLEPALNRAPPDRRESLHRACNALQVLVPQILQFEQIADEPACAFGNDDHARRRDRLQPRGQVRRLADDAALLRFPRSDQVADHDQPGRDSNPNLQRRALRCDELRHRVDQREPGLHGALSVMLVCLGVAEIDQHTVAHILGNEPAILLDQCCAAAVIGADDGPQVLGIEPCRKRGRAYEIAEHHSQLTAFCRVVRRHRDRDLGPYWRAWVEFADRAQHFPPVTEDDAEVL